LAEQALAEALRGHESTFSTEIEGQSVRIFTRPAVARGEIIGAVQVAQELNEIQRMRESQIWTLLLFLPIGLAIAAVGAQFLVRRSLGPVAQVTTAASQIGAGDLSQRLDVVGDDEMARLASTFNDMLGRLQRRFTADVSHELRTPLARLRLTTSNALEGQPSPEAMRQAVETADKSGQVMSRMVQQLLTLARADAGQLSWQPEVLDLRALTADTLGELVLPEKPSVELLAPEEPVYAFVDPDHATRILTNLVENAVRHTPRDGSIRVELASLGDNAVIKVADTGEGIRPEHLDKVWDRFYRADAARSSDTGGSGLGLSIVRSLVDANGGSVEIQSSFGKGTTVTVSLPSKPRKDS
jgi:signal transduction histidine kinase